MSAGTVLTPGLQALLLRARMGMLTSAAGGCRDQFEHWQGYARALHDVERGAGDRLAAKDARLQGYAPLGGFAAATEVLHQDIEKHSRGEVEQLLRGAGIEITPNTVANADRTAGQLENGVLTVSRDDDGEHAAARVAVGDDAFSHPASVVELLRQAEAFITGFEDDQQQAGVPQLLAALRSAIRGSRP